MAHGLRIYELLESPHAKTSLLLLETSEKLMMESVSEVSEYQTPNIRPDQISVEED